MKLFSLLLAGGVFAYATAASAGEHLVGTWTAVAGGGGAIAGTGGDHDPSDARYTDDNGLEWRLVVEDAQGPAFHAQWCSQNLCEDAVGVIRRDGAIMIADEDGYLHGIAIGDTMELCYLQAGDHRIADCHVLEKE